MKKYINDFSVIRNEKINKEHFLVELKSEVVLPEILPGQFAEVLFTDNSPVFLRRPFSIHNVDYNANTISFLIKIIGKATEYFSSLETGSRLNLIYPLGNGFNINHENKKALLTGGGCGVAPLLYLSKTLKENGSENMILIGAKNSAGLMLLENFSSYGKVLVTTEDGSSGTKGFITSHEVFNNLKDIDIIYSCGPEAMLKAVSKKVKPIGIKCEVSLENTMACGIGACLCCVTETTGGNKCVCTEGPVFNINDLPWLS